MKKKLGVSLAAVALAGSLFSTTSFAKENNGNAYGKIDLVGLGDSITFGYGLGDNTQPSSSAFPYLMGEDKGLEVRDLGIPGWTSSDLLNAIKTDKNFRQSIKHANYITLDIGSNDFIKNQDQLRPYQNALYQAAITGDYVTVNQLIQQVVGPMAFTLKNNLDQIIREISTLTDAPIAVYNIYNPFQSDATVHLVSNLLLPTINQAITGVVLSHQDTRLVNAYSAFEGHPEYLISGDVHPSIQGQEILAVLGENALFGSE